MVTLSWTQQVTLATCVHSGPLSENLLSPSSAGLFTQESGVSNPTFHSPWIPLRKKKKKEKECEVEQECLG